MNSMGKRIGIIIAVIVVIFILIVGIILGTKVAPYLALKNMVELLQNEDYTFQLNYSVTGAELPFGDYLMDGTIEGEKVDETLHGNFLIENQNALEIYANAGSECLFNITPVFERMLDAVDKVSPLPLGGLQGGLKDTYVSLEQIQRITMAEDETETTNQKSMVTELTEAGSYSMKIVERPENADAEYLDDAKFYQLDFKKKDVSIILGIPKDESHIYLQISSVNAEMVGYLSYQVEDLEAISMPETNVSDTTIEILHKVYQMWMSIQNK